MRPMWAHAARVFTPEECQQIIDQEKGRLTATHVEKRPWYSPMLFVRSSKLSWIIPGTPLDPLISRAMEVMTKVGLDLFNIHLNGLEPPQFTYYGRFGHYMKHRDSGTNGPNRLLSATIQLNCPDEYKGGKLWLDVGKERRPDIKQGDMVIFPSSLLHKVEPVWHGERYSLVMWAHYTPPVKDEGESND